MRYFPRIKETTTSTPTSALEQTVTLAEVTAFGRFSEIPNIKTNELFPVVVESGNNWEAGIWQYSAANTLRRKAVWYKLDGGTYSAHPSTGITLSGTSTAMLSDHAFKQAAPAYYTGATMPMATIDSGRNMSTLALTANRLYAIGPIHYEAHTPVTDLTFEVTTGVASSVANIALATVGLDGAPHIRLAQATSTEDTSTTGIKVVPIDETVACAAADYYILLIATGAITIRALAAGVPTMGPLGNNTGDGGSGLGTNSVLYLYRTGSGSTIDAEYTSGWTSATSGAIPLAAINP